MKKVLNFFKNPIFYLILILLLGFYVRLYKIDNPIADWHSWRQADTAAVARNFFKLGFTPLVPIYDDMSGVAEMPIPNPNRYRFVEFPIYNSLVYFSYLLNGGVDERLARLVSIIFSLGSTVFIYLITRKFFGNLTGLLAALFFAILPYNIYFSRVILPEPTLVFFSLGSFYFIEQWIWQNKRSQFFLSLIFMTLALLVKPTAIFYLLPLLYSYYQKEGKLWPIPKRYWALVIPAVIPFLAWRVWILQHPEGIPASKWLLNGNHIRFKPIYWFWIFQDRLGREILTVFGTILMTIGLIFKPSPKSTWTLHFLALSNFLYLIIFATGNVQHDYYQTLIVPVLVIFAARGVSLLIEGIPNILPRIITIPMALLFAVMMIYTGWGQVKGLYQVNNPAIVEAGKKADQILPKDAIVIAPYQGDTSFLYQTNRAGWPVVGFPIEQLIKDYKASYYISTAKDAKTNWVMQKYTVLENDPDYVIVDLTRPNPLFDPLIKEPS